MASQQSAPDEFSAVAETDDKSAMFLDLQKILDERFVEVQRMLADELKLTLRLVTKITMETFPVIFIPRR